MFQFDKQPNNTVILIGKLTAVLIYSLLLFLIFYQRERIIIFFIFFIIIYLLTRFAYEAPRAHARGVFKFFGERNPPKHYPPSHKATEGYPHSSTSSRMWFSAKADKNLILSIYVKELIHDFNQGFSSLQQIIGNASNFIILFVTYFIGIGSIWLITRLTKKKFLNLETKNCKSYWISSNMGKESRDKYYRQF